MKYTLITGASAGIGKEAAIKFASKGHNLILIARREELLLELKNEINSSFPEVDILVKKVDLGNISEVKKMYKELKSFEINVFINNAAFGHFNKIWEQDVERIEEMIDLNIKSLTTLSLLYLKDYIDKDATLINVSSVVGYYVSLGNIPYSASKYYVSSFTEGIAASLRNENKRMRVKVLAPAMTETEFAEKALIKSNAKLDINNFYNEKIKYHTSNQMAGFLWELYESDKVIGIVDTITYDFKLIDRYYPTK